MWATGLHKSPLAAPSFPPAGTGARYVEMLMMSARGAWVLESPHEKIHPVPNDGWV